MMARLSEIIEQSTAFLRSGTVTGIDSVRRHLLHASWAGSTAIRYVTPRGPTHDDGPILEKPGTKRRRQGTRHRETARSTINKRV